MRTDQILSADLIDIVFEHRNKNYGAYDLRKFYSNRLGMALGFTFLLASAAFVFLKFAKLDASALVKIEVPDTYVTKIYEEHPPAPPVPPKAAVPKPKQTIKAPTQKFVQNILITKDEKNTTLLAKNLDSVVISDFTKAGEKDVALFVKAEPVGKQTLTEEPVAAAAAIDKITPMSVAEVMPSFPGGMDALRKFLQKNLQNPGEMEPGEMIAVKIRFVVGYDGRLQSFETIQHGGALFYNEVVRVLKKMPAWVPGKSKGQNVSVYYTLPVKFTGAD